MGVFKKVNNTFICNFKSIDNESTFNLESKLLKLKNMHQDIVTSKRVCVILKTNYYDIKVQS